MDIQNKREQEREKKRAEYIFHLKKNVVLFGAAFRFFCVRFFLPGDDLGVGYFSRECVIAVKSPG